MYKRKGVLLASFSKREDHRLSSPATDQLNLSPPIQIKNIAQKKPGREYHQARVLNNSFGFA